GITVTGNSFCSAGKRSIVIDTCRNIAVGSCTIDYNPDYKGSRFDGVLVKDSAGINLNGLIVEASLVGNEKSGGAISVFNSHDITIANCQIFDPAHRGLHLDRVDHIVISGNLVRDHNAMPKMQESLLTTNCGKNLTMTGNALDAGKNGAVRKR
ncbi:MAG: right-handed parallel beta-helix repeat-containing protein, partial [Pirellulaceae bacterium]